MGELNRKVVMFAILIPLHPSHHPGTSPSLFQGWPLPKRQVESGARISGCTALDALHSGWTLLLPSPFCGSWVPPLALGGGSWGIIAGFPPHGPLGPLLRPLLPAAGFGWPAKVGYCLPSWSKTNKQNKSKSVPSCSCLRALLIKPVHDIARRHVAHVR